jgi:hypothetical protein
MRGGGCSGYFGSRRGGAPGGGSACASRRWQRHGRAAGGGRRRGWGLRISEGEGGRRAGRASREAKAQEEWGGAGRLKAKPQPAGPKIGDGPKLKKKFLSNFKLKLGILLDFGNLYKEI